MLCAALLRLLSEGPQDGISFVREAELDPTLPGRMMTAEQSNTSVVYGDELILKLFRRLQPGANPDIEVTKALADAGCTAVAPSDGLDGRHGRGRGHHPRVAAAVPEEQL